MTKAIVAINSCEHYEAALLLNSLRQISLESGFPDVRDKTVLLKPNILSGAPSEKAVTTHPEFVRAVIRLVFEKGASEILVGDSPGVGSGENAARKCGILKVVQEEGARWAEFKESYRLPFPEGTKQKQFYPAAHLEKVDVLISLPKMKTHEMMYYTGAVKNLFGLIPGLNKSRFHMNYPEKEDFAALIVDLFQAVKPSYAFMDGIVAMEGPGPGSGYPRQCGILSGSENLLALDISIAAIMGYQISEIPIFKEALERKIWLSSPDEISYPLLNPEDLIIPDFKKVKILKDSGFIKKSLPDGVYRFLRDIYVPRPRFSKRKCILCAECVRICPAKALKIEGKGKKAAVKIDYNACIRCYCCHEVCPADAIRVGRL